MTRTMIRYKSYSFRTKDPLIDEIRTIMQRTLGSDHGHALVDAHDASNVSVACMRGWFGGKTITPKNATAEAVLRGMGYERRIVRMKRNGHAK